MSKPTPIPRYLTQFVANNSGELITDVLVIGSGVAGLTAAIQASERADVVLLTKGRLQESSTEYAQGGIAAVLNPRDSVTSHAKDTLEAGQGLSHPDVVRTVVGEGARRLRDLIDWGARFDRKGREIHLTREGGHSERRVVHAGGDATGREIERALIEKARSRPNIRILESWFALDLLTRGRTCYGAAVHDRVKDQKILFWASATILCTGGAGRIYRETTNPAVATGDGVAMAYRAGAAVRDMEFFQFHPTTLYVAGLGRILISEAVRGEGGLLRDRTGRRFMVGVHPRAELAPRDIVSRAVLQAMVQTEDTNVYLDLTHLPKACVRDRFPKLYHLCDSLGIDVACDPIPVSPAAHYMIGGVVTDLNGQTNIRRLFACGEVGSVGLHGANRLASNSLLEGLVLGRRVGDVAGRSAERVGGPRRVRLGTDGSPPSRDGIPIDMNDMMNSLKSVMWRNVGVERRREGLEKARENLEFWMRYVFRQGFDNPAGWELQNMLTVCYLTVRGAMLRTESRGVHYRADYPKRDDRRWRKHIVFRSGKVYYEKVEAARRVAKGRPVGKAS